MQNTKLQSNKRISSNPCFRCGKERIELKSWEEKVGTSVIVTKEMICPDPVCQKEVDSENKKARDKSNAMKERQQQRILDKKKERAAKVAA